MTSSVPAFFVESAISSSRRLPIAWRCVAVGLLLLGLPTPIPLTRAMAAEPAAPKPAVVRLVIDYGDGVEKHFTKLPWRKEMTVFDALLLARQHPRGIRLEYRGRAATAMVTQIDGLANQGGRGKNWIYRVNQQPGNRSCGVCPLVDGDTVLWKFEEYR